MTGSLFSEKFKLGFVLLNCPQSHRQASKATSNKQPTEAEGPTLSKGGPIKTPTRLTGYEGLGYEHVSVWSNWMRRAYNKLRSLMARIDITIG